MADSFEGQQIGTGVIRLTAADWAAQPYILPLGIIGVESDTGKWKIGDGSTTWASLGYSAGGQVGATLMTTPVGTVVINEYGDGRDITTVLTLTDFIVGALAGAGAALGIGNIVAAFPAGAHVENWYYQSLSLKAAGTAVNTDTGLGSVIASGAVSVLSGTGTFEDRLTGQTVPTAAGGGAVTTALLNPTAGVQTGIALNVAASVKNVFLNAAGTWNANNTGNLTATGTIVIKWTKAA